MSRFDYFFRAPLVPFGRRRPNFLFLSTLWLSTIILVIHAHESYQDSFPSVSEEYDSFIMDPNHVFGSPLGGWSRATASRLAKLPLPLLPEEISMHHSSEEASSENIDTAYYTTVRDFEGRPYVCRVYNQDELSDKSLNDSFLNIPQVLSPADKEKRKSESSSKTRARNQQTHYGVGQDVDDTELAKNSPSKQADARAKISQSIQDALTEREEEAKAGQHPETTVTILQQVAEVNKRLQKLDHICAQWHDGWWSYEWCHQDAVSQFHVHMVQNPKDPKAVGDIQLQDVSKLGKFAERKVIVATDNSHWEEEGNQYAEGETEYARVIDQYEDGEVCPDTGKPRVAEVTIRCCSPRVMSRFKGGVLFNGKPLKSSIVALAKIKEQKAPNNCVYNATICTPLLCENYGKGEADTAKKYGMTLPEIKERLNELQAKYDKEAKELEDLQRIEGMSVRGILDYVFGSEGTTCIEQSTGGWWTYELCPGQHVRQYHESTVLDRAKGVASSKVETEYYLGRYDVKIHEAYADEDEWKHVVNVTDTGMLQKKSKSSAGGNGAYFYQEYTQGDFCEDPDGAIGGGGMERASTVRYSCGSALKMTVIEDSTCHYIVQVAIPLLCEHPLFQAPVSKRKVIKCLPALPGSHIP